MKIFFISHWGWILYKSRSEIAKKINENYEISVVCPKDEFYTKILEAYENYFEWDIDRTKNIFNQIISVNKLNKLIIENRAKSIFHIFTFKSSFLFALASTIGRKKRKIKAISSITGLGYFFGNTKIATIARSILRIPLKIIFSNTYDYYIFQNLGDKERLGKYLGIDEKKRKIIESSGINTKSIKIKKDFSKKNIKVIMATRLLKEKGVSEYYEIAKKVKESNSEITFFLAGEIDKGNPSSMTEDELLNIKDNDDVTYLGNVNNLQNKLYEYDIAIVTSHHEGFSRFLLEASYVGLYCLSNNLPGTESIIKNSSHGKLINNNEVDEFVKLVISYVREYEIEIENINYQRNFIEDSFSVDKVAAKFVELYSKIELDG